MRAVTKINVGRTGLVSLQERARARPGKCVTGLVVLGEVRFGFDNRSPATSPNQLGADELTRAGDRISPEKRSGNDATFHNSAVCSVRTNAGLKRFIVEINRQFHVARHRFAIAKSRDESRLGEVGKRGLAET